MSAVRCLSVRQPWAWAIVHGLKPVENRVRIFNYRGPILIHAGLKPWDGYDDACAFIEKLSGRRPPPLDKIELGGIVGAAMLTGCLPPLETASGWRFAGQYGLELGSAAALPFRACKGFLGLFNVEIPPAEERALRRAGIRL